jgi:hypothetical protein
MFDDDSGSEGDYISDNEIPIEMDETSEQKIEEREAQQKAWDLQKLDMKSRYELNLKQPVGATIHCPICDTFFVKKTATHSFCSNQRKVNRGKSSCKDKYHNAVDPRKELWTLTELNRK